MTGAPLLAALGSLLWGTVSVVFSPCQIASLPLMVGYVGGQEQRPSPQEGVLLALLYSLGLFLTITVVGVFCALLGRLLGDVGNYWQILVGVLLLWVAWGLRGPAACSNPTRFFARSPVKGRGGAFILGLSYGIIAGSCTFGFIAPILALITVQQEMARGTLYIVSFALGHCLPIALVGSSTALIRRFLEHQWGQEIERLFRTAAALLIALLGLYFIGNPFWGT